MTPAFAVAPAAGLEVVPSAKTTTSAAAAGGRVLALDDRVGLAEGDVLRWGPAPRRTVTVISIPALTLVAPDPGNVVVWPPLEVAAAVGTSVQQLGTPSPVAGRQSTIVTLPVAVGATSLYVSDGDSYAQFETIRVMAASGLSSYYELTEDADPTTADLLTLQTALARSHPAGAVLAQRTPLVDVEALDAGIGATGCGSASRASHPGWSATPHSPPS